MKFSSNNKFSKINIKKMSKNKKKILVKYQLANFLQLFKKIKRLVLISKGNFNLKKRY